MGFFSNLPDIGNKIAQPIYRKIPQAYDAIAKQVNNVVDGIVKPINMALAGIDACNIYITTDAGILFIRNPYCYDNPTPPPKVINDPSYYPIPILCKCGYQITFAFCVQNTYLNDGTSNTVNKLVSGAGIMNYLYTGDNTPDGLQQFGSITNATQGTTLAFEFDNEFSDAITITKRLSQLGNVGQTTYAVTINFSESEIENNGGNAHALFPRYRFIDIDNTATFVVAPFQIVESQCIGCPPSNRINPPPPPKKQECKCMCCDNQQNNNSLLKLLLQRIGNLPAIVPDNFASKTPKPITLDSLAEIAIWQAQQMDALAGQYPIPLTIKADPTDSNSKDQHLELPNQAEALAEILGLLVTTKRDTHATLVGIIKALAEMGMVKNLSTQTYDIAHANAEFLGYKLEQVKRTIPSTFTPNGKNLAETFKETNIDITSYENKDSTDLQDDLKKLLQMAARWNAQNWRTIGANAAVSLAQNFMGNVDTVTNTHEAIKQETFADFLKEVEQGFTHAEGITDVNDPWGNPINEAPTVRQIGITAESAAESQQQVATNNALTGRSDSVTKDVAVQAAITKIANTLKAL